MMVGLLVDLIAWWIMNESNNLKFSFLEKLF